MIENDALAHHASLLSFRYPAISDRGDCAITVQNPLTAFTTSFRHKRYAPSSVDATGIPVRPVSRTKRKRGRGDADAEKSTTVCLRAALRSSRRDGKWQARGPACSTGPVSWLSCFTARLAWLQVAKVDCSVRVSQTRVTKKGGLWCSRHSPAHDCRH